MFVYGGSNTGYSNSVAATTTSTPNNTLSLKLNGTNSVVLSWTPPTGAKTVVLQRKTDTTNWVNVQGLSAAASQATVGGLTPNQKYYFQLVITGGTNNGLSNTLPVTTYGLAFTSFRYTAKTATTATFTWSAVPGATGLGIEVSTNGGTTWTDTGTVIARTATTATVQGLTANTSYLFRLSITGGSYGTEGGNKNNTVALTTNPTPVQLSLASVGADTAQLSWTPATGASSFWVEQSTNSGLTWARSTTSGVLNGSSTNATVTNLIGGTNYQFRVNTLGGANAGYSATVSATTTSTPNNTLSLRLNGTNSVVLTWTPAAGARTVVLQRKTDTTNWVNVQNLSAAASQTTVGGLTPNQKYYFQLVITGGTNNGVSNTLPVTTYGLAFTSFRYTAKTATTATFTWSAVPGATGLGIEVSTNGGTTWTDTGTVIARTATTATVQGLTANTSYLFRLSITGGSYGTEGGNKNNTVALTTNPTPVQLSLASVGADTAQLSWTPATGASSFWVEQSTNSGLTWARSTTSGVLNGSSTNATVTNLIGGTNYQFRVNTLGGANAGYSATVSATTTSTPNNTLSLRLNGTNSVVLTWTPAAGARTVVLQRKTDTTNWVNVQNLSAAASQTTVGGLTPNQKYYFQLVITGGTNNGVSNTLPVTTYGLAFTSFRYTAKTDTTATFAWSAVPGATSLGIEVSTNGGATWTDTGTVIARTATTATVQGLTANTSYLFRLSITGGSYGTEGGNKNNTVALTTNPTPVQLSLASVGADTAQLSWTPATGASSFWVEQSTNSGLTWARSTTSGVLNGSSTNATVTNLIGGTNYQFRVNTLGGANAGYSATVSATTTSTPNNTLSLRLNGTNSVVLTWTPAAGARTVVLQRKTDTTNWVNVQNLSAAASQTTVGGLTPNQKYYFQLVITGGTNNGVSNTLPVTTNALTLTNLRATVNQTTVTASFYWGMASGATNIKLQEKINGAWSDVPLSIPSSANSASLSGISSYPGTHYYRLFIEGGIYAGVSNEVMVSIY